MPGADPNGFVPGVFLWGGCQNRLCLSFGERCARAAGQIELSGIVFVIESGASGWLGR